ncbi:MAG: MotA/TolQ/ExbB proton channel family protein [Spirochaetia bacterium]|nr:MotA/TolQ/ExbB proton channel family protein [Spirochaetia bacterium]
MKKHVKKILKSGFALCFLFLFAFVSYAQSEKAESVNVKGEVTSAGHDSETLVSENKNQEQASALNNGETEPSAEAIEEPEKENLFTTIKQGGWIMYILLGMFLLGMTLVLERSWRYLKKKAWQKKSVEKRLFEKLANNKKKYKEELEADLREDMQLYFSDLENGLNLIHGIGNLAPLIGFFGTVIGMIKAFAAIATASVVNAKVVAVGIQVALVTTAGGLAVAVLTLSFYHAFAHVVSKQYVHADKIIAALTEKLPPYSEKE